jgi:hypothetical protein
MLIVSREESKTMNIKVLLFFLPLLFCCSCHYFLPEGEPPKGNIVNNVIPEKMTREEAVLSLSGRIAASSMQELAGAPVTIEADEATAPMAREALREAGKICGVHLEQAAAAVLNGRQKGAGTFEFELFHFNRSLWRCSYELKK